MLLTLQISSKCKTAMWEKCKSPVNESIHNSTLPAAKNCHPAIICIHTSNHADGASTHQNLSLHIAWLQRDNNMSTAWHVKQSELDWTPHWSHRQQWGVRTVDAHLPTPTPIGWTRDGRSKFVAWQGICHWKEGNVHNIYQNASMLNFNRHYICKSFH